MVITARDLHEMFADREKDRDEDQSQRDLEGPWSRPDLISDGAKNG